MRFSPPFDNTAPASVTPGRGASFADSASTAKALALETQFSNAETGNNFGASIGKPELRPLSNAVNDINIIPETNYQSSITFFAQSAGFNWNPIGSTFSTTKGITVGSSVPNTTSTSATGSFAGLTSGQLQSFLIDGRETFPILLGTSGAFSFYATSAGFFRDTPGGVSIKFSGSCFITGSNGYSARGNYLWSVNRTGGGFPTSPRSLTIYANEAGNLFAQPTNTAPEARQ